MDFESAGPAIVRSIKQRDLLNAWLRLYAKQEQMPELRDYQPERLADETDDLVYYKVISESAAPVPEIARAPKRSLSRPMIGSAVTIAQTTTRPMMTRPQKLSAR